MSNERDQLIYVIIAANGEVPEEVEPCEQDEELADAILAAGYRKPGTVSTLEELDALPNGSIIRDDEGDGWQFFGLMGWFVTGGDKDGSESPTLPATVLYEGDK